MNVKCLECGKPLVAIGYARENGNPQKARSSQALLSCQQHRFRLGCRCPYHQAGSLPLSPPTVCETAVAAVTNDPYQQHLQAGLPKRDGSFC